MPTRRRSAPASLPDDDAPLPPPRRGRRTAAPGADNMEDHVGGDDLPPRTRRLSTADREKAELHATLQKNMRGEPRFPYPPDLPDKHRPYWLQIVNSKPHDYFNDGDTVLLKMYCRAAAEVDDLDREIDDEGHVVMGARGPILNPRVAARAVAETRLLSLSTKLRTQPSSRYDSENDRSQTEKSRRARKAAEHLNDDSNDHDGDGLLARPTH